MKKIYIIRKFIPADSLEEALKLERKFKPQDAWLDEHSTKEVKEELLKGIK